MTTTIGNAEEVVESFVEGRSMRTPLTHVPGGRRVSTSQQGLTLELRSYNTTVAVRIEEGGVVRFFLTTRRYSVTTSKLMGRIARAIHARGYRPTNATAPVTGVKVPGRWGGYGPAWAPSDWETVLFTQWEAFS